MERVAEANRTNISPRQFYTYARKVAMKKGLDLEAYVDYEYWVKPYQCCNDRCKHEDWEHPLLEICKIQPYDYHLYLEGSYNFILEWDDGHGYMFMREIRSDEDGK